MPTKHSDESTFEKKPLNASTTSEKSNDGSSTKNDGSYRRRAQRAKKPTGSSNTHDHGVDMVRGLKEIFPEWSIADLRAQLDECHQDVELVINRISSGVVSNWQKSGAIVKKAANHSTKTFIDYSKKRSSAHGNHKTIRGKSVDAVIAEKVSVPLVSIESSAATVAVDEVNSNLVHDGDDAVIRSERTSSIDTTEIEQLELAVSGLVVAESVDAIEPIVVDIATASLDAPSVLEMPVRVTSKISSGPVATTDVEEIHPVVILPTKANCRPRAAVNRVSATSAQNQSSNMIGDFFTDLKNSAASFSPSSNPDHKVSQKIGNASRFPDGDNDASTMTGSVIRRPQSSPDQKAIRRPDAVDLSNSPISASPRIPPGIRHESSSVCQEQRSIRLDSSTSSAHYLSTDVRLATDSARFTDTGSDIRQYRSYAATDGISYSQSYCTDYNSTTVSENYNNNMPHRDLKQNWNAYNQNTAPSMTGNGGHNFGYNQQYQPQQYSPSSFYSKSSLYADDLDANSISYSAAQNQYQLPQPLYSNAQRSSPHYAGAYSSSPHHHQNASMNSSMYYRSGNSSSMSGKIHPRSPHHH